MNIKQCLKKWLRESPHVHVRQNDLSSLAELVQLFDRFLFENKMRYPLEWDDFISWPYTEFEIEASRECIGKYEKLLFSKNRIDRDKYASIVLNERNRIATQLGLPLRDDKS